MKRTFKENQKWDELRKARDRAERQFENYAAHNKDETNPVYRQLQNRMIRAQEMFYMFSRELSNRR